MRALLIISLVLISSSSFAFISKDEVTNTCEFSWVSKDGLSFLRADIGVVVDLTDSNNKLEQTDYFRIQCKGKVNSKFKITGSQCAGIKINITNLINGKSHPVNTDVFFPEQIDINSKPNDSMLNLSWKDGITFSVIDGKSFTWTLKSVMSGKTFSGTAPCTK